MLKNPFVTAVVGLLVGFFVGYVVGQGPAVPETQPAPASASSLPEMPPQPPSGGRTQASSNPQLMEQARDLERLVAQDPTNYTHLVQLANVYYDLSNYAKASDYYEKARSIKDDSADVLTDLGVSYRELGQPKKAVELFERATALAPDHWQSRYNEAVVYLFDLDDPSAAQGQVDELKKLQGTVSDLPDLAGLEQEIAKRSK